MMSKFQIQVQGPVLLLTYLILITEALEEEVLSLILDNGSLHQHLMLS